jgi:hypothetical protein
MRPTVYLIRFPKLQKSSQVSLLFLPLLLWHLTLAAVGSTALFGQR